MWECAIWQPRYFFKNNCEHDTTWVELSEKAHLCFDVELLNLKWFSNGNFYLFQVLKQHKLSRSITDLNKSLNDQDNNSESAPLQSGLSFDKWLSRKLKIKREAEELKRSAEAYHQMQLEK